MVRHSVPRTYTWTTSVWQGDVDPFGELHTTAILRFLQETAHRASADAGYGSTYYQRTDRMWLVRRTTVRFFDPIRYGHEMEGRTWVAGFHRVRSQRMYEIRVEGRLRVHGSTDWVFADQSHGHLRRIPEAIATTFRPEGGATERPEPFPTSPPASGALRFPRRVEAHELDNLNHVNNANYARYVEEAVLDALTVLGWPLEHQRASGGRLRRSRHDFEYLAPALYGDQLEAIVWPRAVDDTHLECLIWITRPEARRPLLRGLSRYTWTPTSTEHPPAAMPPALQRVVADALAGATGLRPTP